MLVEEKQIFNGIQRLYRFENNQGASVVRHDSSYGGDDDLFELAVIKWTGDSWDLDYTTPITNDVIGWLKYLQVLDMLDQISQLPVKSNV